MLFCRCSCDRLSANTTANNNNDNDDDYNYYNDNYTGTDMGTSSAPHACPSHNYNSPANTGA